jgi:hypothetical protein
VSGDDPGRRQLPREARGCAGKRRETARYQATIAGKRSVSLKLVRRLTIVSRRATRAGTRITGRLSARADAGGSRSLDG